MSYRFELREKIGPSFARIATEQIDRVLRDLTAAKSRETAIHETRKSLKRLRALFRLVRPDIGNAAFKDWNSRFRDVGALLSADRDRHVLLQVTEQRASAMGARYRKTFAAVNKALAAEETTASADTDEAIAHLKAARKDVAAVRLHHDHFATLQSGLEQSYRRGRSQLRDAYADPGDEAFHDLRKAVQQHWRHMQVLQRAWPELFVARLEAARRVSQILGDDHDLAVFVAKLKTLPRTTLATADRRAIERHCRVEQDRLRTLASPYCEQLYAERPGQFAKRIGIIWQAAARLADIEEAQRPASGKAAAKAPAKPARAKLAPRARRGNSAQADKPAA